MSADTLNQVILVSDIVIETVIGCLFIAVLVHNYKGSKAKFVYKVAGLLTIFAISNAFYDVLELQRRTTTNEPTVGESLVLAVALSSFLVGHWILAEKYYCISNEVPLMLQGKDVPDPSCWSNKTVNRLMIITNIVSALISTVLAK